MENNQKKIWKICQLNAHLKVLIESCFPYGIWLEGEVSNLIVHNSGHVYFSLKDSSGQISATWFGAARAAVEMKFKNGMQIEGFGMLSAYAVKGTYQINLRKVLAKGSGSLQQKFEELKAKLQHLGLFDLERKKQIPLMSNCVGVITSLTGAAIKDFLQITERRFRGLRIKIFPAIVQGENVADDVCAGIDFFNQEKCCDVIVITRGGGSAEDLWGFNSEKLALKISSSQIPIISAIGHEIDFTIPDFVADLRAPTPSAAAELVCAHQAELVERIINLRRRLISALILNTKNFRQKIETLRNLPILREPLQMVRNSQQKFDEIMWKLQTLSEHKMEKERNKIKNIRQTLSAFNPENVLKRGYALVYNAEKNIIKKIDDVMENENLTIQVFDGKLLTKILEKRRDK